MVDISKIDKKVLLSYISQKFVYSYIVENNQPKQCFECKKDSCVGEEVFTVQLWGEIFFLCLFCFYKINYLFGQKR